MSSHAGVSDTGVTVFAQLANPPKARLNDLAATRASGQLPTCVEEQALHDDGAAEGGEYGERPSLPTSTALQSETAV